MPDPTISEQEARSQLARVIHGRPKKAPLRTMAKVEDERVRYRKLADGEPSGGDRQQPNDADFVQSYVLDCGHRVWRVRVDSRTRCGYCFEQAKDTWDQAHAQELRPLYAAIEYWETRRHEAEIAQDTEAIGLAGDMETRLTGLFARLGFPASVIWDLRPDGRVSWDIGAVLSNEECAALILRLETLPGWVDARDDNHERTTTDAGT